MNFLLLLPPPPPICLPVVFRSQIESPNRFYSMAMDKERRGGWRRLCKSKRKTWRKLSNVISEKEHGRQFTLFVYPLGTYFYCFPPLGIISASAVQLFCPMANANQLNFILMPPTFVIVKLLFPFHFISSGYGSNNTSTALVSTSAASKTPSSSSTDSQHLRQSSSSSGIHSFLYY